jgi:phage terminase large subunit-like protein
MIEYEKYQEYAKNVVNGEIVACKYIQLACERYLDWFKRDDIEFRSDKADKVVKFCEKLKHFTGRFNNQHFILQPFQKWMVYNIFGFYYKGTEERVIKNVWIELARKNGKSFFAAAIALYALIADGENNSEVEFIANSRKQAQICFDMCANMVQKLDPKKKFFKTYRDKIKFDFTKSFLQVLSSDSGANDGWNSYLFVADEVHAYSDSKMFDVMKSSQGMRDNPLAISITTAGFNLFSFAYRQRSTNVEVLLGNLEDDSQFSAIYTLDDEDDYRDENVWIKANPNLGVTVKPQYLKEQVQQAKNNPSLEISTRTKNFNQWLATSDIWINNELLCEISKKINIEDYKDQEIWAYMGVDLSAVSDLTCVSLLLPFEDKFIFKNYYYLPQTCLSDNSNADLYRQWQNKGLITITTGNVVDYDYIIQDILKINEKIPLTLISYDKWNSTSFAISLTELGMPIQPYPQSIANFSIPTKTLERLIKKGDVIIDDNEITRYCFSNVVLKHDWNDNVKPVKEENQQKIDGVIAMIQAMGGYLSQNHYNNEIFGFQVENN